MNRIFDTDAVVGVLQGLNPWWLNRKLTVPAFKRLAYQVCRRYLDDSGLQRAVLLSGPRRVGKTTILCQIADALLAEGEDPRRIFYVSLDHPLLKLLTISDILRLYHETIRPEGKPTIVLLDEVQYSADWELHVKQLIDHKPEYRILATESASVEHKQKLSDSGVGRWISVQIPTLSFYEFLRIRGDPVSNIPSDIRPVDLFEMRENELKRLGACFHPLLPLFRHYLLVGGFPETSAETDASLCQRLLREDVVEKVLKRDMVALFRVRNVNELEKLFIYICINCGGIFSTAKYASALGATPTTVSNHLKVLEQANLIYRLPPYKTGGKKVLKARHKIYLVDAALRNAVLLRGEEILNNPEEMGVIVETTVLRHLFAYYYRDLPQISYWRNPAGLKEVDIIVKSPSYILPVEVKYRENAALGEKSGLVNFCRQEKARYAYWISKRTNDFGLKQFEGLGTRFLQIPAHIFTYLLGQAERLLWSE